MKKDGTEQIRLDSYNSHSDQYKCTLLGVHPEPDSGWQRNDDGQIIIVFTSALHKFLVTNPEFRLSSDLTAPPLS